MVLKYQTSIDVSFAVWSPAFSSQPLRFACFDVSESTTAEPFGPVASRFRRRESDMAEKIFLRSDAVPFRKWPLPAKGKRRIFP
jgi:hypothetical protein